MTIAEIAARAGVSKTAVSRYLNDGSVSQEKRERIRAVIEETGYTPSRRAQDLRRGSSRIIGVILPRIDSEPISRIVDGINGVLEEKGFQLLLTNTADSIERELKYLDYFKNDQVDGILFVCDRLTPRHRQAIAGGTAPVVVIGRQADYVSCVYYDAYASAFALTGLLLGHGRRRLGMIHAVPRSAAPGTDRLRGFSDAMRPHLPDGQAPWVARAGLGMDDGYAACRRLLDEHPDLEGLLCTTDPAAVGAIKCLRERGLRVPGDVAVAGMGHYRLADIITPRLTTVHFPYRTSGIEAARMLLDILEQEVDPLRQRKLECRIVEQQSTAGAQRASATNQ